MIKERIIVICIGYLLDRMLGDPHGLWHPVQGIGKIIEWIEHLLWKVFKLNTDRDADKTKKRIAGAMLVILVLAIVLGISIALLYFSKKYCPWLNLALSCLICYQMLALKSLRVESMKVFHALNGTKTKRDDKELTETEKLEKGRTAVSMIVGRDTKNLSKEEVIKATVETIAENTSDGVIAPLFYMILFGPLGGIFYKTVNTMDSMIAYKNDRYLYFGTVAAKLDDVLNFIPSRLAAFLMIASCDMVGLDRKNAWNIYKRDRRKHASPNSAQTESVCAGALNVELAGPAYYFGTLHDKPTIGDANRKIELEDIELTNRLLYATANMMFLIFVVITMTIYLKLNGMN